MLLNKFIWNNYLESEQGMQAVKNFDIVDEDFIQPYLKNYHLDTAEILAAVYELYELSNFSSKNTINNELEAKALFEELCTNGITLSYEDGTQHLEPDHNWLIETIVPISIWLHLLNDRYFKPYFFIHDFRLLTQIADTFGMSLPEVPKKSDKKMRFNYYWSLCEVFTQFEKENSLSPEQMCAFLYDFAPRFISGSTKELGLPEPTQVWLVGGDKYGQDFHNIDNCESSNHTRFWQGNANTKRGDIILMYCLSPRSYIHSIWRATADGILDPFFYWYSSITIAHGQKIPPILLKELKVDSYFKENKLVRKNFQGVNGFQWSAEDYSQLLNLVKDKGSDISKLPVLFAPEVDTEKKLENEKEVETHLIEPLLNDLGFKPEDWVRQLVVKMGTGEKVYPDYVFLSDDTKGYEQASIVIEAKFHIKNNRELEIAFRQMWSYGLRLSADLLILTDKHTLWVYERNELGFDRNNYEKIYWEHLSDADVFNRLSNLVRNYKSR